MRSRTGGSQSASWVIDGCMRGCKEGMPAGLQAARLQADRLLEMRAVRDSHLLGVDWSAVVTCLHAGQYDSLEAVAADVYTTCHAAADHAIAQGVDLRLGRLKGLAEQLALALQAALQVMPSPHDRGCHVVPCWLPLAPHGALLSQGMSRSPAVHACASICVTGTSQPVLEQASHSGLLAGLDHHWPLDHPLLAMVRFR